MIVGRPPLVYSRMPTAVPCLPTGRPRELMRFLLKALTHIPLPILYGFGFVAYCIVFHVMRWRRDRAEADIANAFPEKSAQERADIVRRCYRNLADTVVEAFWGFGASADALKARVKFEDAGAHPARHRPQADASCCSPPITATGSGCCSRPAPISRSRSTSSTSRSDWPRSTSSCATCAAASAASSFRARNSSTSF